MAYEEFGGTGVTDPKQRAAMRKLKEAQAQQKKGEVIDTLSNIGALVATMYGGPAAGTAVKGVGGVVKGLATKDAGAGVQGAMNVMGSMGGNNAFEGLLKNLQGAKSLESAKAILKSSGIDVGSLTSEQQQNIFTILGKF